jgi:uncharacterized protein
MRNPENQARPGGHAPTALVAVNGDDVHEDIFTAARELQTLLTDEGFAARTAVGAARFADAAGDDVVVLYTALGEFTTGQRRALARAVGDGTGLVAVHSANVPASPPDRLDEADLLLSGLIGSRYVSHGPPPHESRFTVRLDPAHEVTAGIAPFEVTHEHYHLATEPGTRTVAWRETPGGAEPLVHVRRFGRGRVCYLQLGHDMRIWGEPRVRLLARRAARWTCRPDAGRN